MVPFLEWFQTRWSLIAQVDQLKEELRQCRSEQERAVLETAAKLKLAEASITAKNHYLSNLSHDLRTPGWTHDPLC